MWLVWVNPLPLLHRITERPPPAGTANFLAPSGLGIYVELGR